VQLLTALMGGCGVSGGTALASGMLDLCSVYWCTPGQACRRLAAEAARWLCEVADAGYLSGPDSPLGKKAVQAAWLVLGGGEIPL
jgi:hypothetical protein